MDGAGTDFKEKSMELFCNHCFKDIEITLAIKGPHVTANCSVCKRYIKHLNAEQKIKALQEGLVAIDGGTSQQKGDRNVHKSKESDTEYERTDSLPGVW
jgi:hypothetical protein